MIASLPGISYVVEINFPFNITAVSNIITGGNKVTGGGGKYGIGIGALLIPTFNLVCYPIDS